MLCIFVVGLVPQSAALQAVVLEGEGQVGASPRTLLGDVCKPGPGGKRALPPTPRLTAHIPRQALGAAVDQQ